MAQDKDRHGRPTCSECMEAQKVERGCNKPGECYGEGRRAFSFTSPALQGDGDHTMRECPTGYTLRESPETYDLLSVCSMSENCGPAEFSRLPLYTQHAIRLYRSEIGRHMDRERADRQAAADGRYLNRVRL